MGNSILQQNSEQGKPKALAFSLSLEPGSSATAQSHKSPIQLLPRRQQLRTP